MIQIGDTRLEDMNLDLEELSRLLQVAVLERFHGEIDAGAESIELKFESSLGGGRVVEFIVDGVAKEL